MLEAMYIKKQQPNFLCMSNTLTTQLTGLLLSIDRYLSSDIVHEDTPKKV